MSRYDDLAQKYFDKYARQLVVVAKRLGTPQINERANNLKARKSEVSAGRLFSAICDGYLFANNFDSPLPFVKSNPKWLKEKAGELLKKAGKEPVTLNLVDNPTLGVEAHSATNEVDIGKDIHAGEVLSLLLEEANHLELERMLDYHPRLEKYIYDIRSKTPLDVSDEEILKLIGVPEDKMEEAKEIYSPDVKFVNIAASLWELAHKGLWDAPDIVENEGFQGDRDMRRAFVRFNEGQARYRALKAAVHMPPWEKALVLSKYTDLFRWKPSPEHRTINLLRGGRSTEGLVYYHAMMDELPKKDAKDFLKKVLAHCVKKRIMPGISKDGKLMFFSRDGKEHKRTQDVLHSIYKKDFKKVHKALRKFI